MLSESICRMSWRAAGAKGEANGELAFPRSGASEQHGGEIGAGDQEHCCHRAQQNHQSRPHSADDQVVQRINGGAELRGRLVVVRKERMPVGDDCVRLRLRLGHGHAGLQPANDAVAARPARFQLLLGEGDRFPDIGPLGEGSSLHAEKGQREFEFRGHDPNDGEAAAVDGDLCADQLRIGIVPSPPETLAHDDHAVVAFTKFALAEDAAFDWRHAQERKQTRGDRRALDSLRHVATRQVEVGKIECRDALVAVRLFLPIKIFRRGDGNLVETLRGEFFEKQDKILRRLERQRTNQQRIDEAENRGVRGDRQGDGDDGNESEARRLDQATEGETNS